MSGAALALAEPQGYVRSFLDADPALKAALADMHPAPLQAYATYPYKSENYYGFPQMPDILINYYRKDVVCHEEEQKNFQAKYNQKLPCTPEEMDDVDWDTFEKFGGNIRRTADALIAATAIVHHLTVVTRNTRDFASFQVKTLNPFATK